MVEVDGEGGGGGRATVTTGRATAETAAADPPDSIASKVENSAHEDGLGLADDTSRRFSLR